jgi:hypothetical protein
MRTHKQLVEYQSILQVLQEPGCPFFRFLKEYQAAGCRTIRRMASTVCATSTPGDWPLSKTLRLQRKYSSSWSMNQPRLPTQTLAATFAGRFSLKRN